MIDDRLLDLLDRKVGEIAKAFLSPATEEVPVAGAIASLGFRVDQPGSPVVPFAPEAEQPTLQVVLKHPVTLTGAATHIHDVLYAVEEVLRHNRLMPAGVQLTFVRNPAGVVRVLEHLV
ncbi:hypothetical protein [Nocardia sp. NPDC004722]